MAAQLLVLS